MRRFMANRWWTFILALCIGLASIGGFPAAVFAGDEVGDGGTGYGDPDMPAGPYYAPGARGGRGPKGGSDPSSYVYRTAGDGARGMSLWMSRLHVVVRGLYFRF